MAETNSTLRELVDREYQYGFVTEIESDQAPPCLNQEVVRLISAKKNEPDWLLDFRLKALERFLKLVEEGALPTWSNLDCPEIDFQDIIYYSAPKQAAKLESLDEIYPQLLETYEKLGISLN